ncbi:MAG TPA: 50S ribosomal protein L9 [Bacilli bacterium]|nr:50S ribosomal protein L9 [Bacilli bacterium]
MKVIFLKALKKAAKEGDIKEVSDGYAKNYLIPNKIAIAYTEQNKKLFEISNQKHKKEEEKHIEEAEEIKKKLEKEVLIFKVKAGEKDHLFGSISTKHIADELNKKGYVIDKRKIMIDVPLNALGDYKIKLVLHNKVEVILNIRLEK